MAMEIIHDPAGFQARSLAWRAEGRSVGFVPTMGALHDGHYALIERARRETDRLSASIFVNPIQFGPGEDLDCYPRTLEADTEGCRSRGVDLLFVPRPKAIYPPGFQTRVRVDRLSRPMCGERRPGHFEGVATVVLKLLMLAQPDAAYFGWKDAQQLLVVRRMARDLDLPVRIEAVETVREPDGLAMSSRNAYLTAEERAEAPRLWAGLSAAREAFESGARVVAELIAVARGPIDASPLARIDYLEARCLETLAPLEEAVAGGTLLAGAIMLGRTRLIDNIKL